MNKSAGNRPRAARQDLQEVKAEAGEAKDAGAGKASTTGRLNRRSPGRRLVQTLPGVGGNARSQTERLGAQACSSPPQP